MRAMTHIDTAQICHEANRALQYIQADRSIPVSPPWAELDEEIQASAIAGVEGVLDGNSPRESHEGWCEFKIAHGWKLGPVKDEVAKTHPLLVDYDDLPAAAKLKDALFVNICLTVGTAEW